MMLLMLLVVWLRDARQRTMFVSFSIDWDGRQTRQAVSLVV